MPLEPAPAPSPSASSPVGAAAGKAGEPLFTAPPQDGATIATTLDVHVQNAAEGALAKTARQPALVAPGQRRARAGGRWRPRRRRIRPGAARRGPRPGLARWPGSLAWLAGLARWPGSLA
ncbi:hypothetical protein [Dactylosporangium sp. NPDC051484]|uniref:hypothetical protein n=1 Tax=Dactylosporangium sp. NPDC051484 TaxID=3154942 RepID=UPI00344FBCE4